MDLPNEIIQNIISYLATRDIVRYLFHCFSCLFIWYVYNELNLFYEAAAYSDF